jgi:protein gp37
LLFFGYNKLVEWKDKLEMAMHANWNPWHGCIKCSEGCQNCYVYYLDGMRGKSGADIYKTKTGFKYPLSKYRNGQYKIQSGEMISVCMTSDFFLEEADAWRPEAWKIMSQRRDVKFLLLTKRPQRVRECLPDDWEDGWDHIFLNVTCENQTHVDERIPILLELPFKHKGLYFAPMLGEVSIEKYLDSGQIEQVACGGENYGGSRPCDFEWVKRLRDQCVKRDITFCFMETGTTFIKDGTTYKILNKQIQNLQAYKSGMTYQGKPMDFKLVDRFGNPIPKEKLYVPHYAKKCEECSFRILCNGCSECGYCEK